MAKRKSGNPKSSNIDLVPKIGTDINNIANELLMEEDIDKVKDLTNLFNLNIQKKNALRILQLNKLLNTITDRIENRFETNPDNFSNEDLLKYMQAFENSVDKSLKSLKLVEDTPPIQLTQNNQVNINVTPELSRDSRERILEAVKSIISQNKYKQLEEERNIYTDDT